MYLGFVRERAKRGLPVSNGSASSVASELRVGQTCPVTWTVQLLLRHIEDKSVLNYDIAALLEDHRIFKHTHSMHHIERTFPV